MFAVKVVELLRNRLKCFIASQPLMTHKHTRASVRERGRMRKREKRTKRERESEGEGGREKKEENRERNRNIKREIEREGKREKDADKPITNKQRMLSLSTFASDWFCLSAFPMLLNCSLLLLLLLHCPSLTYALSQVLGVMTFPQFSVESRKN